METYVVLIPLKTNRDARKQCELIENVNISIINPTELKVRDKIITFIDDDTYDLNDLEVERITDFMDRVNDQDFNPDSYFISYVNVYPFNFV